MTYADALAYLDSLTNYERRRDPQAMQRIQLERMQRLCRRLGRPEAAFRSVLVAGTNGKGSICAMIYAMLRQAGLRTGLYTSPHLEDVRERIRVSSTPGAEEDWISEANFASSVRAVRDAAASPEFADDPPTYFEVMTAVAFRHFFDSRVSVAVLEVGLGGRLDATNVVEQAVSVIAPIGQDHTDVLGAELASIAREKAGIIKPHGTVVVGVQPPEAAAAIAQAAAERGARLLQLGRELQVECRINRDEGMTLDLLGTRGAYRELWLPLIGGHQADNAAVAVAAVEALSEAGVPHAAIQAGLASVSWPGRLEVVQRRPVVVLDGAHNVPAAQALRAALAAWWPERPLHVLMGLSADKAVADVAAVLAAGAASVVCTKSRHPRACDPQRLADACAPHGPAPTVIPEAADALTYALNAAGSDGVIVVTGSLFLVGELRPAIRAGCGVR